MEGRLVAGHYESDLIMGADNRSVVVVIVERISCFTMLCHLPAKNATSVREAFTRACAQARGLAQIPHLRSCEKEMAGTRPCR